MYEYRAHIRSIHDGDSLRADIDLGFGIWRSDEPLRLHGVDAPELGKPGGREARDWLRELLPTGTEVTIRTHRDEADKYGRMLAQIWDRDGAYGDSINDLIIDAGHARPYNGGKR